MTGVDETPTAEEADRAGPRINADISHQTKINAGIKRRLRGFKGELQNYTGAHTQMHDRYQTTSYKSTRRKPLLNRRPESDSASVHCGNHSQPKGKLFRFLHNVITTLHMLNLHKISF